MLNKYTVPLPGIAWMCTRNQGIHRFAFDEFLVTSWIDMERTRILGSCLDWIEICWVSNLIMCLVLMHGWCVCSCRCIHSFNCVTWHLIVQSATSKRDMLNLEDWVFYIELSHAGGEFGRHESLNSSIARRYQDSSRDYKDEAVKPCEPKNVPLVRSLDTQVWLSATPRNLPAYVVLAFLWFESWLMLLRVNWSHSIIAQWCKCTLSARWCEYQ